MNLPLDARNPPIKPKYLDEETKLFSRWMIFGIHKEDDTVDIVDAQGNDIIVHISVVDAVEIIEARDTFVSVIMRRFAMQ